MFLAEISRTSEALLCVIEPLQHELVGTITSRVSIQLQVKSNGCTESGRAGAAQQDESGMEATTSLCEGKEVGLRHALQVLLIAMGDLNRYEVTCAGRDANDWIGAMLFYKQAARVAPFDGCVYRPLAAAARARGDIFAAGYYLSRSMTAPYPYAPAREAMLEVFEAQRIVADQYDTVTALSGLGLDQHIERFKCHFLAAAGIAYSRTGADRFQFHMDKCKRHLSTLLQLLTVETIRDSGSGLGSKGDFRVFDKKSSSAPAQGQGAEASSASKRHQKQLARGIDTAISQAVVIALSLITSVANKYDLDSLCRAADWTQAYGSRDPSDLSTDDRLQCEKRFGVQCLHRIQAVPGLLDILRLLLGIVTTLVGSEGVGVGVMPSMTTLSGDPSHSRAVTRIAATARSLGLFLDWLKWNPNFSVLSVLDKTTWEQMEKDLPAYVSALAPLAVGKGLVLRREKSDDADRVVGIPCVDCLLEEDFDTDGLAPLQALLDKRVRHFIELIGDYQMSSIDQDTISKYAVRFVDEEWISICAARCTATVRHLCNTPVCIGSIYFNRSKEITWPAACTTVTMSHLPVIVYKAASSGRSTGFTSSGYQTTSRSNAYILSEEEFMRGEQPPALVAERAQEADEGVDEDGGSEVKERSGQAEGDISDLSDDDDQAASDDAPAVLADDGSLLAEGDSSIAEEGPAEVEVATPIPTAPYSTRELLAARCATLLKGNASTVPPPPEPPGQEPLDQTPVTSVPKGMLRVTNMESFPPPPAGDDITSRHHDRASGGRNKPPTGVGKSKGSKGSLPYQLPAKSNGELPLVVIDAPNVAMRHGINAKFSCLGIKLAIDFFHRAGHRVVSFLPVRASQSLHIVIP